MLRARRRSHGPGEPIARRERGWPKAVSRIIVSFAIHGRFVVCVSYLENVGLSKVAEDSAGDNAALEAGGARNKKRSPSQFWLSFVVGCVAGILCVLIKPQLMPQWVLDKQNEALDAGFQLLRRFESQYVGIPFVFVDIDDNTKQVKIFKTTSCHESCLPN